MSFVRELLDKVVVKSTLPMTQQLVDWQTISLHNGSTNPLSLDTINDFDLLKRKIKPIVENIEKRMPYRCSFKQIFKTTING